MTPKKKQTAMDWFVELLQEHFDHIPSEVIKQAKQKERQQTIDFANQYIKEEINAVYEGKTPEEFYNKVYGKK